MLAVFAAAYIAKQTIERTTTVRIHRVFIEKPRVATFGFVENGFDNNAFRHS